MYIVFHTKIEGDGPETAKFDDLAKVEMAFENVFHARERTSRTTFLLAHKNDKGWVVAHGPEAGTIYRGFWLGNNTEVYAALHAIASGVWAGPACAQIANDALRGHEGVEAAIERLDSGVFI